MASGGQAEYAGPERRTEKERQAQIRKEQKKIKDTMNKRANICGAATKFSKSYY